MLVSSTVLIYQKYHMKYVHMDRHNKIILKNVKCTMANTSVIWQQAARISTTCQLLSLNMSYFAKNVRGISRKKWTEKQEDRARELGR